VETLSRLIKKSKFTEKLYLLLAHKSFDFRAVVILLENLSHDFYYTTVESKLFDCPFQVAAPLSGSRSCSVSLKSQLCECLAAKKGPLFWRFAQKLIFRAIYNGHETNRLSYFYPPLSLSFSLSAFLLVGHRDCRIVEGVRPFRR